MKLVVNRKRPEWSFLPIWSPLLEGGFKSVAGCEQQKAQLKSIRSDDKGPNDPAGRTGSPLQGKESGCRQFSAH